jgi:hypothetical protein
MGEAVERPGGWCLDGKKGAFSVSGVRNRSAQKPKWEPFRPKQALREDDKRLATEGKLNNFYKFS